MAGGGPIPPKGWVIQVPAKWLEKLADFLEVTAKEIREMLKADEGYRG